MDFGLKSWHSAVLAYCSVEAIKEQGFCQETGGMESVQLGTGREGGELWPEVSIRWAVPSSHMVYPAPKQRLPFPDSAQEFSSIRSYLPEV